MKSESITNIQTNSKQHITFSIYEQMSNKIWQESEGKFSLPGNRLNAYINRISQEIIFPFIKEECPDANICQNQEHFWELGINGSAINLDQKEKQRLIIIPSEDFETTELFVNAEWIDIPNLVGDYYLAVQVDLEEEWVKIWAYTTHSEIKKNAHYIERNRSYSLSKKYLIEAPYFLWTEREVYPNQVTRREIKPIPILLTSGINKEVNQSDSPDNYISQESANNYLIRLGNPNKLFPRRELKFETWGALLQDEKWRTNLYNLRLAKLQERDIVQPIEGITLTDAGLTPDFPQYSRVIRLLNWFKGQFDSDFLSSQEAIAQKLIPKPAYMGGISSEEDKNQKIRTYKVVNLGEEKILLIIDLTDNNTSTLNIRFRVKNGEENTFLPSELELMLEDETEKMSWKIKQEKNQNLFDIELEKNSGDQFTLSLILGDFQEKFTFN